MNPSIGMLGECSLFDLKYRPIHKIRRTQDGYESEGATTEFKTQDFIFLVESVENRTPCPQTNYYGKNEIYS